MKLKNDDESTMAKTQSQREELCWNEDEEFSSELVQDYIFNCYDREKR